MTPHKMAGSEEVERHKKESPEMKRRISNSQPSHRPILFSAPMVLALLDDRKLQTRRIVKPQPAVTNPRDAAWYDKKCDLWRNTKQYARDCCPYGKVGDFLWVKETWRTLAMWDSLAPKAISANPGTFPVKYDANNAINRPTPYPWGKTRPSLFMMQAFSRITLEITGVRVERLQDISESDALAEGIQAFDFPVPPDPPDQFQRMYGIENYFPKTETTAVKAYKRLYESINGIGSWARNDYVWVLEFRRVK